MEWKEAEYRSGDAGPIYNFRRGYKVRDAGRHENAKQFACFQQFLQMGMARSLKELAILTGYSPALLSRWSRTYQWERRTAAWQKDQLAITWKKADRISRDAQRDAIVEFRQSSERQARMMSRVSEDLVRVLGKRIAEAEENNEKIPLHMVGGLLKAAASLSEQSRESWGNALGINELLEVVDAEVEKVRVVDVEAVDPYEFEIDE